MVFYIWEAAARELYDLLSLIWEREYVPSALVRTSFIMFFIFQAKRQCKRPLQVSVHRTVTALVQDPVTGDVGEKCLQRIARGFTTEIVDLQRWP